MIQPIESISHCMMQEWAGDAEDWHTSNVSILLRGGVVQKSSMITNNSSVLISILK